MTTSSEPPMPTARLACVVLAHNDPSQVRRLIDALDPFPVLLHCDRRTPEDVFRAMTDGLPYRVTLLPRLPTPWASWNAVAAELSGYRAALATTDATHVATMAGSDYPLASTATISAYLERHRGLSIAAYEPMPRAPWGRDGGMARLRYWHRPVRRHMLRVPIPRRIPGDVVPAGGSVLKVLARSHAQQVVDAVAARPDLVRFWRHTWAADEIFIPTILNTPAFVPDWAKAHVDADLWFIDWPTIGRKSPEWLELRHLPILTERARADTGEPALFARKFSSRVPELLDAIDLTLRSRRTDI